MEPLAIILGIGIIVFFLLYMANSLKISDSFMMVVRFFLIMFSLYALLLLGKALVENDSVCTIMLNQTIELTDVSVNHTITNYTYGTYCISSDNNTAATTFKMIMRVLQLFFVFLLLYTLYKGFEYLGLIAKIKTKWARIK
jgi:hypothetical protein